MGKRDSIRREMALADRLRREASQSRPDFSESLHARICDALKEARADAAIANSQEPSRVASRPHGRSHDAGRWKRIAAATAACVAGAALIPWLAATSARRSLWTDVDSAAVSMSAKDRGGKTATNGFHRRTARAPGVATFHPPTACAAVSELAHQVSGSIDDWIDATVAVPQWAYLDEDAQVTVQMLAARLPFDIASSLAMTPAPIAQP